MGEAHRLPSILGEVMSWLSKTVKKAARSVKKHLGKHWWVPGYNIVKSLSEFGGGLYDEYKRNEGMYNRMALMIAGSMVTGGVLGAAAGAAGLGGMTTASGAAAGATTGAISGSIGGGTSAYQEKQTNKAIEEQEKIQREAKEEQERIARLDALKQSASMPTEQSAFNFLGYSRQGSQIKKTRVSRNSNKTVGGSSTTLG